MRCQDVSEDGPNFCVVLFCITLTLAYKWFILTWDEKYFCYLTMKVLLFVLMGNGHHWCN